MLYSDFGKKFSEPTGIGQLMDDLAIPPEQQAQTLMLGGGNPGYIPEMIDIFRDSLQQLLDSDRFADTVGSYGAPAGLTDYTVAVSNLLNNHYGWDTTPANIAVTNGSQNAFFLLFNLFAGPAPAGPRKILLPLVPEYIGYGDVAVSTSFFSANRPTIEILDDHTFKYRINFEELDLHDEVAAVCISRPTNPTGNVMTDAELDELMARCRERNIPLIIDNAYGAPFPNIMQANNKLRWDDNTILTMSLSKLGLPALRTGIVVADETVIRQIGRMNAVVNLTPGSIGAAMTLEMMQSGDVINYSNTIIQPFYQRKAKQALAWFVKAFAGMRAHVHKPEGAFFLWMWFPELPITAHELYQRLKSRGVIVVPGHYFFPGLATEWQHRHECIRVSYATDDKKVETGINIIAEEVKLVFGKS